MKVYEIQKFGIDELTLNERDEPTPAAHEVLIRFHAASLNYRDYMVVNGTYNPRMKTPAIPLSDGAGEVIAIGAAVTKWKVGARVMPIFVQRWFEGESTEEKRRTALGAGPQWDGVLREMGAFNEDSVVEIPEHLSYKEAATLPCAAITAWNALAVSGKIKAGDTVLTLGTGGVSIFAVQFAKMFGARVIATSSSDEKIERLRELGVDETINYRTRDDWDAAVLDLTDKRGVDHVVEVGGSGTLAKSLNAVRIGGHVAMIGALAAGDFSPVPLFMKSVRLQGVFTGSRSIFEDMNRAVSVNELKPVIDRVFNFDDVKAAFRHMESGAHFGKIVIEY
ncbi:MAG TPA: NAD(P)-dependent alcohol dehydrogenase [Pyrinomonadaceae bacterium]|nr:NAD(P)-dependent alcohol dehydrogenase [Chloracidobacterium sp.]MBP9935594.1 NAD(P)-dependent alcohol dehydrogenase [Pyrinomonadaceae bacterium]MBK7802309.1 NAD(P)-dependent alcohol dehydrogenase [Chloracidobacterium sp.]MBL0239852.1 NAD(P)-dependent alcohol dehydrogenase [Chloracidobacterium sp.]HQX55964.1 NAD(P)-dependent alcohol dehydrogenase [Pyrinomonadaceae bacterium]